ncbi:hypothetical protein RUND412_004563 [Rhizina undulata]
MAQLSLVLKDISEVVNKMEAEYNLTAASSKHHIKNATFDIIRLAGRYWTSRLHQTIPGRTSFHTAKDIYSDGMNGLINKGRLAKFLQLFNQGIPHKKHHGTPFFKQKATLNSSGTESATISNDSRGNAVLGDRSNVNSDSTGPGNDNVYDLTEGTWAKLLSDSDLAE